MVIPLLDAIEIKDKSLPSGLTRGRSPPTRC